MPPQKQSPEDIAPRSRACPLIDLRTACALLRTELSGMGKEPQRREALTARLGYHSTGGGIAARKVAALAHYGILVRTSDGYALSDNGRYLQRLPESSPEYRRLLRSTLEIPALFRRILEHYRPVGKIPPARELAPVLTGEQFGITGTASADAAEVFWRSALYSGVLTSEGEFIDPQLAGARLPQQKAPPPNAVRGDAQLTDYKIPLPNGRFAYFHVPQELDLEDVKILGKVLDGLLDGYRANVGFGQLAPISQGRPHR